MARISGAGFVGGLMAGMQLGQKVRDSWDEADLAEAMKGATQQQQTQVEFSPDQQAQMNELSKPVADGAMPPMDINVGAGKEITKTVDRQFGSSADKMAAMREAGIAHLMSKGKAEKAMDWQAKAEQAKLTGMQAEGAGLTLARQKNEAKADEIYSTYAPRIGTTDDNGVIFTHADAYKSMLDDMNKNKITAPERLRQWQKDRKELESKGGMQVLAAAMQVKNGTITPEAAAQQIESGFNGTGKMKIDKGSVKVDAEGNVSYMSNGKGGSINALAWGSQFLSGKDMIALARDDAREKREDKKFEQQTKMDQQRIGISGGHLALAREEKELARKSKEEIATANFNLFKENNPGASPARLAAAKAGILKAVQEENSTIDFKPNDFGGGAATMKTKNGTVTIPVEDGKQGAPIVFSKSQFQQALKEANAPAQAAQEGALPPSQFVQIGGKPVAKVDIVSTAKKYGITEDEVVRRLATRK